MSAELVALAAALALVYLAAGAVKGLLGLGLPTTAIGLAAQIVDARQAIVLAVVPMILANAWQVARCGPPRRVLARVIGRHRPLAASMLVAIGLVSLLAARVSASAVTLVLGVVMTLFALASLVREPPPLPERLDRPAQLVTGALAGAIGGISGVWAPPIIVYLGARRLEREQFVETIGVLLLLSSAVLFVGYVAGGLIDGASAWQSLALTLPTIGGFALGERLRRRTSPERFRHLVLGFFLLMGLNLVRRALSGAP